MRERLARIRVLVSGSRAAHNSPMSRSVHFTRLRAGSEPRHCDHPECGGEGVYRAPKSRDERDSHYWFCLDHVRAYNAAWDFFAGMDRRDIEFYQHSVATWHRPTWRFGGRFGPASVVFDDPLGIFATGSRGADAQRPAPGISAPERTALAMLDLEPAATLKDVKARYKTLAKRFHPDANGGSRESEERFKTINQAYSYLLNCGSL